MQTKYFEDPVAAVEYLREVGGAMAYHMPTPSSAGIYEVDASVEEFEERHTSGWLECTRSALSVAGLSIAEIDDFLGGTNGH